MEERWGLTFIFNSQGTKPSFTRWWLHKNIKIVVDCMIKCGFPGGSRVKNPPAHAMWDMWVRSQGREDPLEKEMETHPSILAW